MDNKTLSFEANVCSKIKAPLQGHRRYLDSDQRRDLARFCSLAFGIEVTPKAIEKIMNHIAHVEKRMIGRIASHVEDLIIHYLMRFISTVNSSEEGAVHLEIGTLFGGSALLAHHAVTRMAERAVPIHVLDPFAGYYGRGNDIITGEEITRENFLKNVATLGIPEEDFQIHQGLSTDQSMIDECRSLKLFSLHIDGDHSYNGVRNDWINYSPLVVKGGYVLVDNYNDATWPDVMKYMNKEAIPYIGGEWEIVLVYATSLLLRRVAVVSDDERIDLMQSMSFGLKEKDDLLAKLHRAQEEQENSRRQEVGSLSVMVDDLRREKAELEAAHRQEVTELTEANRRLQAEKDKFDAEMDQLLHTLRQR